MPIYEYKCDRCDTVFEVIQKFVDTPLTVHEACGGAVHRLISTSALQFKGSGFYITDYKKSGSNGGKSPNSKHSDSSSSKGESSGNESSKSESSSSESSKSESSKSESSSSSSSSTAPAAAPSTSSSAGSNSSESKR